MMFKETSLLKLLAMIQCTFLLAVIPLLCLFVFNVSASSTLMVSVTKQNDRSIDPILKTDF